MNNAKLVKMKDSDIAWLGGIPEGWRIKRLKYIAKIQTGGTPLKSDNENYSTNGIPWIKPDNLDDLKPLNDSYEKVSEKGLISNPIISKDDILVCCIGTVGKMGVAGCDLTFNQQINSVQFYEEINKQFGKYLILSSQEEHLRNSQIVVLAILNKTKQSNIKFPLPPIEKQDAIANYLDKKTAQIGKFIDDKKKMIGLLKEQKQAIIHQATTKGIDKNAKMKDSSIAWLGQIPEDWKMLKFKFLYKASMGATILAQDLIKNGKIPVYSATESDKIFGYVNDSSVILEKDDLVIPARGNSIGNLMIVKEERATSTQTTIYAKKLRDNKNNIDFIFHYCKSLANHLFEYEVTAIPQITVGQVKENPMLIPPVEIQKKIVAHIKKETSQIDIAIKKIEQEIELVEEYKKSLIFHAVTGKITIN